MAGRHGIRTVLLADDHDLLRSANMAALRGAADQGGGLSQDTVFIEARNAAEATRLLTHETIDVAVLDVHFPDGTAFDVIRGAPDVSVAYVILTGSQNPRVTVEAQSVGVYAVLTKGATSSELVQAVENAGAGKRMVTALDAKRASETLAGLGAINWDELSARETMIANLIADGLSDSEIGDRLFVTAGSVRNILSAIYRKAGVADRQELQTAVWTERKLDRA